MTPKQVMMVVKENAPQLSPNTLKTYETALSAFMKTMGVKTMGGAFAKTPESIEKALESVEKANTRASQLNAFVSVIKHAKIPMGETKLQKLMTLNDTFREDKMKPMEQGVGASAPNDFDAKVTAYLKDHKGTRESVFIATMALAPTVRPSQFEDVRIARSQEEFDAFKQAGESVLGAFGSVYRLWTKPEKRKVKSIDTVVEYTGGAMEALKAYIKPTQTLLFPSHKYPTESVKTQMIAKNIKKAFEDAGLGKLGAQKLRRIVETENQNDPSKSREEKEAFSKQMNHGRDMGDQYKVVKDASVVRSEEAEEAYVVLGKTISKLTSQMPRLSDVGLMEDITTDLLDILEKMKNKPKPMPKPAPELPKNTVMYRGQMRPIPKETPKPKTVVYYGGRTRLIP